MGMSRTDATNLAFANLTEAYNSLWRDETSHNTATVESRTDAQCRALNTYLNLGKIEVCWVNVGKTVIRKARP